MTVDVHHESGETADLVALTRLCRFTMAQMRLHPGTEMTLKLVDRDTIASMNERWMGKQGPTDVLSFPMDELEPGSVDEGYLGDVALCVDVAAEQAPGLGRSTVDEVELLVVHGILHLLGYDHAEPDEHRVMFGLQDDLLAAWRASGDPGTTQGTTT